MESNKTQSDTRGEYEYKETAASFNYVYAYWQTKLFSAYVTGNLTRSALRKQNLDNGKTTHDTIDSDLDQYVRDILAKTENKTRLPDMLVILCQLVIVREVAAFDAYMQDIIMRVYTEVPGILKSNTQTTYADVLQFDSMEAFKAAAAEQIVMTLTYKSITELLEHLNKKHGTNILVDSPTIKLAVEYIEIRNIIAHNKGIVNRRFIERTNRTDLKAGELYPLEMTHIDNCGEALFRLALDIDKALASHFKLCIAAPSEMETYKSQLKLVSEDEL